MTLLYPQGYYEVDVNIPGNARFERCRRVFGFRIEQWFETDIIEPGGRSDPGRFVI
jgi:hypothetical protein